ncbi:MAG: DUF6438 domain-containing protein [Paludibacter sp.]|nr:DUF6438 domain-containing protein [Paludibacter sp.]
MKARPLIILLTVLFLASCKTGRDEEFRKSICGEWIFAGVGSDNKKINDEFIPEKRGIDSPLDIPYHNYYKTGYIFYSNNLCEDKFGYSDGKVGENLLGTDTKYKVENDSLKIFDLDNGVWKRMKIRNITSDTLTLDVNDSTFLVYTKCYYKDDKIQTFDQIIVSTSPCFGSCSIGSTSIDNQGNFIFYGQGYTEKEGLFISRTDKELYKRIEQNFKKADIDTLYERYAVDFTDAQTVTVTFIKNNKIYKTISDYGHKAPRELYWAYNPVSLLYQKLNIKPFATTEQKEFPRSYTCFENKGKICCLEKSESFYLFTEICKCKEVHANFEKKYVIEYWETENNKKKILTDGRYYQLEQKDKTMIFDLGYNFLTRNNLLKKFRTKTEND